MKRLCFERISLFRKLILIGIACCIGSNCDLLENDNSVAQYHREFTAFYSLFFIVPDLDFNQFCPPTDQIPILEPGTHTRFMQAGDTYIFDNRARLNAFNPGSLFEYFTFIFQENPGQEVQLVSLECGASSFEYQARQDTGLPNQLENVYIGLKTPPFGANRSRFFTKFKGISGSGTITFTTPSAQDPPQ
ncbi:hypothetical protein DLM76_16770 [Leptospira yasudae]|uniref:LIC_10705 family lipoprotein n=1 Tax=Leptospira yasudae TaxID=2202201 RepID=UPI000E599A1E|nr:LIC_10705 family lipoprotein [Leptospira yasudae]RHX91384.1 hypothetical protein DLM76_16770 [Leptospira yasudae]